MQIILLFVIIVSAVILTGVILLQESKGSELGAGFGRGAASGLAGQTPMHGATFLTRLTAILAAVFFASTLALSLFVARDDRDDLLENLGAEQSQPFESTETTETADDDIPTPIGAPSSVDDLPSVDDRPSVGDSTIGETTAIDGDAPKEENAADKIPE